MKIKWPNGKRFAFTIIDDTDNGTVANLKPVYDFLFEKGLRTTKTVWVKPSRDGFTGGCLLDPAYYDFIQTLNLRGFEIALHNVGSGSFARQEIKTGIQIFRDLMGYYPTMQINHASNPDNIYWGVERYTTVLQTVIKLLYGSKRRYYGTDSMSEHFWGDIAKAHFKYIRNHTFNGINTLRYDPKMPYRVEHKEKYSNYWFSSSDGHTIEEFNNLILPKNIIKLERQSGLCIVYTHFASGFVTKDGYLDHKFKKNIEFLSQRDGWFAPAGQILDHLLGEEKQEKFVDDKYLARLDFLWIFGRLGKKIKYGR